MQYVTGESNSRESKKGRKGAHCVGLRASRLFFLFSTLSYCQVALTLKPRRGCVLVFQYGNPLKVSSSPPAESACHQRLCPSAALPMAPSSLVRIGPAAHTRPTHTRTTSLLAALSHLAMPRARNLGLPGILYFHWLFLLRIERHITRRAARRRIPCLPFICAASRRVRAQACVRWPRRHTPGR